MDNSYYLYGMSSQHYVHLGRMPSVVNLHLTLRFTTEQFKEFENMIRTFYHNELHCCIQGTMELPSASNTPEFLLHHMFIDKLWYDWQNKGPEYRMILDDNMQSKLTGSHYKVVHFMDPNKLGYFGTKLHYKDPFPGYKRLHATLSLLDLKTLKMLDSYDENVKRNCCPRTEKEIKLKDKETDKILAEIPREVAIDYNDRETNWE